MLSIDVFTSGYKPIAAPAQGWDPSAQATWPATTSTLISGEREAVLVDALITAAEADRLVDWIQAKGKELTAVYVTHGHADHFLGLSVVLAAFPSAIAVALPEVVPYAQEQLSQGYLAYWESLFPGQLPAGKPVAPEALHGEVIWLEGEQIRPVAVGQSDTHPSSVVHVPSAGAVVGGDVGYNGIHMWLAGTDAEARQQWLAALDIVEALRPNLLVVGHQAPEAPVDDVAEILAFSRRYLVDFDIALAAAADAAQLIATMTATYGKLGNPYTLFASATAQFASPQ
ncbi:MBL fold metallo-hydrolase [Actinoplanes sp. M2I2]|uniref:MBL fold metallo-hydrolase n=1 Tax=Actinoplanes sp. M2I2 TaxID=1734444 RepID=UPI00201FF36D|nr:MBL fold metallo-hydrolase [Actinoplanes sp. M2I2]